MDDARRTEIRTKLLRGFVLLMFGLGLVAIALSYVPSLEIYSDRSDCHSSRCAPVWVLEYISTPVENPVGNTIYFVALLLPGLLVWKRPVLRNVMLWNLLAFAISFVMLITTFQFSDNLVRTVELPLAYVFAIASVGVVGTLILVVPPGCLLLAIVTRARPPKPPELPSARVVRNDR